MRHLFDHEQILPSTVLQSLTAMPERITEPEPRRFLKIAIELENGEVR
jgi:hypothetical protein